MGETLKYRQSVIEAKRLWESPQKKGGAAKKIIFPGGTIAQCLERKQDELQIFGGGVAILSKAEGKPVLLYSPKVQQYFGIKDDMHEYEFLNTPYKVAGMQPGFENFIDLLFFVSRETKYPEYVKNIQNSLVKNKFEYPFQHELRQKYEILHCSSGEVLFFILLWRLTVELIIKNESLSINYDWSLFNSKRTSKQWYAVFEKSGRKQVLEEKKMIELIRSLTSDPPKKDRQKMEIYKSCTAASNYFTTSLKPDQPLSYIFEQVGLSQPQAILELNKYLNYLFPDKAIQFTGIEPTDDLGNKLLLAFSTISGIDLGNISLKKLLIKIHETARFPILPYFFLMLFDQEKELKEHIVFPLWYTFSQDTKYEYKKNKFESAVLHALYTIRPIWNICGNRDVDWYSPDGLHVRPEFEHYLDQLCSLFTSLSKPIIDTEYYAEESQKSAALLKRQAVRSAISQYMCRNLSHNLGSHSIPQFNLYLDQKIESKREENYWSNDKLYQIRGFNEYMQGRMEFLAEFSSSAFSELYIEYPFNAICNNLYNSLQFYDDIPNSGSYEIVFKGMIDSYATENLQILINDIPSGNERVDIRGDNLGIQAFYIIIENIIRNLYKHSNKVFLNENIPAIIFNILISEEIGDPEVATDYFAIDIIDRHGKVNESKWDSLEKAEAAVNHINALITQEILNPEDNTLREEGWGLLEMKSAAAYLSGMPDYAIDTRRADFKAGPAKDHIILGNKVFPYPLTARLYADEESAMNIAYRFYLPKTKFCMIEKIPHGNQKVFRDAGIEFGNKTGGRHKFFISDNIRASSKFINQRFVKAKDIKFPLQQIDFSNEQVFRNVVWSKYLDQFPEITNKQIIYAGDQTPQVVSDPQNCIVFDVHGKNISLRTLSSSDFTTSDLFPDQQISIIPSSAFYYYESFPSSSKLPSEVDPLSEPYNSMLKEAAVTKVAIFDERIQAYARRVDSNQKGLLVNEILLASKVYIPPKDSIDLMLMSKSPTLKSRGIFEKHLTELIEFSDYIILHFTLLEVCIGSTSKDEIEHWLKSFVDRNKLTEKNKILVLISGRGKPSNLPKGFYFANYTMIADCVTYSRSKLRLVSILKSLRK